MPTHPPPPAIRFRGYSPEIHGVETLNYDLRLREVVERVWQERKQSTFLTVKYGLIHAEVELERISNMKPGWDSYGAAAPSATAIRASSEILNELAGALILPSAIVPSAEGGVSIYFMSGDRTAYIETDNEGSQALVMYDQQGNTEVLELTGDHSGANVSTRISTYLG